MTTEPTDSTNATSSSSTGVSKYFGNVIALTGRLRVSSTPARSRACSATTARASRRSSRSSPACTSRTRGELLVDGERGRFGSPREALDAGIATVYQDLAIGPADVGLAELLPRRRADAGAAARSALRPATARSESSATSCSRWASTSATPTSRSARCRAASGSRWRSRAPSTSAPSVLILDEPTSRAGRQAGRGRAASYIVQARDRGVGVDLHHPQPAPRLPGR